MRLHYRLIEDANGYVAECVESDAMGEGKSAKDAIAALRTVLEERMFRPDAVAPPAELDEPEIELVRTDELA